MRVPEAFLVVLLGVLSGLLNGIKLMRAARGAAKVHLMDAYLIFLAGNFVDSTTPAFHAGGEPFKAYYLNALYGDGKTSFIGITLLDRFYTLFATLIFTLLAMVLVFFQVEFPPSIAVSLFVVLILLTIFVVSIIFLKGVISAFLTRVFLTVVYFLPFSHIRRRFPSYPDFQGYVQERSIAFLATAKKSLENRGSARTCIALALLAGMVDYFRTYMVFRGLGERVPFLSVFVAVTVAQLAARVLGFVPAGFGVTEASLIGMFSALRVKEDISAAATLLDRSIFYMIYLGLGYLSILILHWRLGSSPGGKK